MSYDLMVFGPSAAPRQRQAFLDWYSGQVRWAEPHDYTDPKVASPGLAAWFLDIIESFPPLNGPFQSEADHDPDASNTAEYSIGSSVIYVCFRWSRCDIAYSEVRRLAAMHGVGFFDASGEGTDTISH